MRYNLTLLIITLIAATLRLVSLTTNPPELNIDEIAFAYDAYSILQTMRDHHGNFLPLAFESVGDYKSPGIIYLLVPFISFFGLTEFATRLPTALLGTFAIPLLYFLTNILTKNKTVSVFSAGALAISPWHIYYSRIASDHLIATTLLLAGSIFLFKILEEPKVRYQLLTALFLSLSMYFYHSHKVAILCLIPTILILSKKGYSYLRFKLKVFFILFVLLTIPLVWLTLFGEGNKRAEMVFITKDTEYTRYVILDHFMPYIFYPNLNIFTPLSHELLLLPFFWASRLIGYLDPNFLFLNGLGMTNLDISGLGVLYLYDLLLIPLGIISILKKQKQLSFILGSWILISIIPASFANNEFNAGRTLLAYPPIAIISAFGLEYLLKKLRSIKKEFALPLSIGLLFITILIYLHAFVIFSVHFPIQKSENFMYGSKNTILYALSQENSYNEIIISPRRGISANDIINTPHLYYFFYAKLDPKVVQSAFQNHKNGEALQVGKYTFKEINWYNERLRKNTLFITSPWNFSEQEIKKVTILEKFYLLSGELALVAVVHNPDAK